MMMGASLTLVSLCDAVESSIKNMCDRILTPLAFLWLTKIQFKTHLHIISASKRPQGLSGLIIAHYFSHLCNTSYRKYPSNFCEVRLHATWQDNFFQSLGLERPTYNLIMGLTGHIL